MVLTVAKAETPESVPAFVQKFEELSDLRQHCAELKRLGYTHFVNLHAERVTIGDITDEYRIMSAGAFFKGTPPPLSEISQSEEIPFVENRKFYSDMSSIGRLTYGANLTGDELNEWTKFFESELGPVSEIDELI